MRKSIYLLNSGELRRENNTICLITDDGKRFLPVEDIGEIHVFGEVDLNKRLLEFLSEKEIILHYYNHYDYYMGSFYPREHFNSGYMTVKQAEHYINPELRICLARAFVTGAVKNIRQVLMYYRNRGKEVGSAFERIEKLMGEIDSASSVDELMAYEGNIRDAYYGTFDLIIDNPDFVFEVRSKRPPKNRLNALISFGNTLLYTTTLSEIYRTHLDPRIGYLHTSNFRRFSLNLDVAEIFKPILVDRLIFYLTGKQMLKKSHFEKKLDGVVLSRSGRTLFIQNFEQRMMSTIKHRELGRQVSYRRLIRMELYKLEKHLMGEADYQPFVARW
ncbi:MAG: CRISPR-associated endonuclease Cas1 [Thermacetogenium phaeum]|uniref:CRISPR-associated endonuclease Cas1 n=1 Tax=Thermacetogenium phaeum TaxID=85874 RepID=A0A101FFA4_9THEO|nr:MAG: CRISPR-associated endonuclease Cas1 [Thermacetogenium phaeum]